MSSVQPAPQSSLPSSPPNAMSTSKNAVIVGGSLGGLLTGVVLKRLGHKVTIFERSPTPLLQDQGAGIVAGGDTLHYLKQFDRIQKDVAVISPVRHYLNIKGEEINREEWEQKMTSWDLIYHVLRANFDGVSSDYVDAPEDAGQAKYEYGFNVTGIKYDEKNEEVVVSFTDRDKNERNERTDRVFAADGPSSTIRGLLVPSVKREYAGYVAWRGTVVESRVSQAAKEAFVEKFTFYHAEGIQILAYVIPGKNGTLKPGERLINWVWYNNYPDKKEVMTDAQGTVHPWTNQHPPQKLIQDQRAYAKKILPPQFAELVELTDKPFIQAITDVISPQSVFHDGHVVLLGDAVAGFRPHTAASTSQAAFHALKLNEYLRQGQVDWPSFEDEIMKYARNGVEHGKKLGNRSQFQNHRTFAID